MVKIVAALVAGVVLGLVTTAAFAECGGVHTLPVQHPQVQTPPPAENQTES